MSAPKKKPSLSLSEDLLAIVDATANRMKISRSEVVAHLILYHGLCGGDFPLTARIFSLPAKDRDRVISEARKKSESSTPPKPQAFRQWIKEIVGTDDPASIERSADALIRGLLNR